MAWELTEKYYRNGNYESKISQILYDSNIHKEFEYNSSYETYDEYIKISFCEAELKRLQKYFQWEKDPERAKKAEGNNLKPVLESLENNYIEDRKFIYKKIKINKLSRFPYYKKDWERNYEFLCASELSEVHKLKLLEIILNKYKKPIEQILISIDVMGKEDESILILPNNHNNIFLISCFEEKNRDRFSFILLESIMPIPINALYGDRKIIYNNEKLREIRISNDSNDLELYAHFVGRAIDIAFREYISQRMNYNTISRFQLLEKYSFSEIKKHIYNKYEYNKRFNLLEKEVI